MDNGLIISQNKLIDILNSYLFCSYNVLTKLLDKFSLIIEHSKTETFHFNRTHRVFNPPHSISFLLEDLFFTPKNYESI